MRFGGDIRFLPGKRGLLLMGALLACSSAQAIVDIERMRGVQDKEGVFVRAHLSFSGDSGNSERSDVGVGGRVQTRRRDTETLAILDYIYGESRGISNRNRSFLHLRYGQTIRPLTAIEGFAQVEQDEFARLGFRGLLGAGFRFRFRPTDIQASLGVGAFHSWERLTDVAVRDQGNERLWRANLYFSLSRATKNGVQIHSITYYQPRIGPMRDFRLLQQLGLRVPITQTLGLHLSLDLLHDSQPPRTVKQTDTHYKTALEWQF